MKNCHRICIETALHWYFTYCITFWLIRFNSCKGDHSRRRSSRRKSISAGWKIRRPPNHFPCQFRTLWIRRRGLRTAPGWRCWPNRSRPPGNRRPGGPVEGSAWKRHLKKLEKFREKKTFSMNEGYRPPRPNGVSFARFTTSSSVSKGKTQATDPNISSRTTSMSSVTLVKMHGLM